MNENAGKVKYSVDELTVAYILYGANSKIYKAMHGTNYIKEIF